MIIENKIPGLDLTLGCCAEVIAGIRQTVNKSQIEAGENIKSQVAEMLGSLHNFGIILPRSIDIETEADDSDPTRQHIIRLTYDINEQRQLLPHLLLVKKTVVPDGNTTAQNIFRQLMVESLGDQQTEKTTIQLGHREWFNCGQKIFDKLRGAVQTAREKQENGTYAH